MILLLLEEIKSPFSLNLGNCFVSSSAEGWREEELLAQPWPQTPTMGDGDNPHLQQHTWAKTSEEIGLRHLVKVNKAMLIYTSTGFGSYKIALIWRAVLIITSWPQLFLHCAKWRGKDGKQNNLLRTKCSWKNMQDTNANAWKHLAKMGRRLKFSPSTLMGTHWNLTTALSYGNTTALIIQAVRLEILTSTSEGGKMTPLLLLSIEIKQFATKGKRMHLFSSVCFQSQQCV